MRAVCHYVFAVVATTIYGGQVCPFLDSLDALHWLLQLTLFYGAAYALRAVLLPRVVEGAPAAARVRRQFGLELSLYLAVGAGILAYNFSVHDFPLGSGAKVVLSSATLGLFAAADLALEREREAIREFSLTRQELLVEQGYVPLPAKLALGAGLILVSISLVAFLVVLRDMQWIMGLEREVDTAAALSILKEFAFVLGVYLAEVANVLVSFSKNLRLLLDNENSALARVAEGDFEAFVPVATPGEFGVMAGYTNRMIESLEKRTDELLRTRQATIESLAALAEYRDPETGGHIKRTMNYVRLLAGHLKDHPRFSDFLDEETIDLLYRSAPLHDVGKVGVPDSILLKPGKLTDEEFEEMKKHTTYGRDALRAATRALGSSSFLKYATEIAYTHQEKWDGSGYPQALSGDEIPISGRLMAVADVYDALISRRVYKPPFPHSKAVEIIREGRGAHFDPDMVDAFLEVCEEFRQVALEFADFDEERETLLQ